MAVVTAPAPIQDKPSASVKPSDETITGSIKPQANLKPPTNLKPQTDGDLKPRASSNELPKIPGIRIASLGMHALPAPETERWAPAVGYNPVVAPTKQVMPQPVRKPRYAKAYRPYRAPYYRVRPSWGFAIGVPLRW